MGDYDKSLKQIVWLIRIWAWVSIISIVIVCVMGFGKMVNRDYSADLPYGEYTVLNVDKYKGSFGKKNVSVTIEDSDFNRYYFDNISSVFKGKEGYGKVLKIIPGDKVVVQESGIEVYYNKKVE